MYFAVAVAVAARGFHCLFFDGPGQGEMLIEQGMPMRPDWEAVIRPVVDFALDPARRRPRPHRALGLEPRRLPRAARRQRRAAPRRLHRRPGPARGDDAGDAVALRREARRRGDARDLARGGARGDAAGEARGCTGRWSSAGSGCTASKSLGDYAEAAMAMTLEGRVGDDPLPDAAHHRRERPAARTAPRRVFAELTCPKTLLRFTAAEGAGDHCEMANRSLATLRMLDWLATLRLDG